MRLGSRSPDEFIQLLNKKNEVIQQDVMSKIVELTNTVDVKVMMGDSTIILLQLSHTNFDSSMPKNKNYCI